MRHNTAFWAGLLVAFATARLDATDCGIGPTKCPACHTECQLKVESDQEEKSCWQLDTKDICIPKVVFPWQKSCCDPCVNNGACVKKVKVLKKQTFECPTCKYTWLPRDLPCGGCACQNAECDGNACRQRNDVVDNSKAAESPAVASPTTMRRTAATVASVPPLKGASHESNTPTRRASLRNSLRLFASWRK